MREDDLHERHFIERFWAESIGASSGQDNATRLPASCLSTTLRNGDAMFHFPGLTALM